MPRESLNGIDLHYQIFGAGHPLLLLHGFTGSIQAWQGIPERLGEQFRVIAVDLIGHGETFSPDDPDRYRIEHAVEDLCELLNRIGIDKAAVLGYSMGGRVALHLTLARPERVTALILENSAPGIADPVEREERITSDEKLARMIERRGLETFIDFWESIPLFASQKSLPDHVRQRQREVRMSQNPTGLANSLRGMGAGAMEPVDLNLGEHVSVLPPVLYVAGEYDEKYRAVGRDMVNQIPDGRYVEIQGAGHTVHLEQPEEYVTTVSTFLQDPCHPERT